MAVGVVNEWCTESFPAFWLDCFAEVSHKKTEDLPIALLKAVPLFGVIDQEHCEKTRV